MNEFPIYLLKRQLKEEERWLLIFKQEENEEPKEWAIKQLKNAEIRANSLKEAITILELKLKEQKDDKYNT